MVSFDLKVGFSCCNSCQHCVITDKSSAGDLSTDKIKEILLQNSNVDRVVITGGEATIRRDFFEILRFAKEEAKIPKIFLQTNGRMFYDFNFSKEASEYLYCILIAIHSHNSVIHDMITQRKGSWKQTTEGARNLVKIGKSHIRSQTVISKLNCDNLPATYDFIYNDLNIKFMNLTFPHPNGNAWTNFDRLVPTYESMKRSIDEILIKYKDVLFIEAIPKCYLHPIIEDSKLNDRMNDEIMDKGYDASNQNPLVEDYNSLILSDHRKAESCKRCFYYKSCAGVWKEYFEKRKHDLDLYPVYSDLIIPITIRSTDFTKTIRLIESIKITNQNLVRNLIVFVDSNSFSQSDIKKLRELSDIDKFKVFELKSTRADKKDFMLKTSLKFSRAISLSDDIIIEKEGMFHLIDKLLCKDNSVLKDDSNDLVCMNRVNPDIYFEKDYENCNVNSISSKIIEKFYGVKK